MHASLFNENLTDQQLTPIAIHFMQKKFSISDTFNTQHIWKRDKTIITNILLSGEK